MLTRRIVRAAVAAPRSLRAFSSTAAQWRAHDQGVCEEAEALLLPSRPRRGPDYMALEEAARQ